MVLPTQQQLFTKYFSGIALVLVVLQYSLFHLTLLVSEEFASYQRIELLKEDAIKGYQAGVRGIQKLSPIAYAYQNSANVPPLVPRPLPQEKGEILSLFSDYHGEDGFEESKTEFVYSYDEFLLNGEIQSLYIVLFQGEVEADDVLIILVELGFLLISIGSLFLAYLLIAKVSNKLAAPITATADYFEQHQGEPNQQSLASLQAKSREVQSLIDSLAVYQQKVAQLVERERRFTRYASHELRTPLMVMKGANSLLKQSQQADFVLRQQQRIEGACDDMQNFIEALLSLQKISQEKPVQRAVAKVEIQDIVASHLSLLQPGVHYQVEVAEETQTFASETLLQLLLGNLVKNAFSHTQAGSVNVTLDNHALIVTDTGTGLGQSQMSQDSHGLGLLIVKDICRLFHWQFQLQDNLPHGCRAHVSFEPSAALGAPPQGL
ncbi:sensor histidine kinase [Motilimonas pumila]|uniref:histidine kinase n=1 Tax=Motilimonas pumila TaxID=2303987 RepID=A0A418YBI8_9GAMM|nr:HAMP domain-containing sensor histidine kinase [Motilimonas pumila]RJG40286.1 sensor histidine kinase [Motilimonas pumila]